MKRLLHIVASPREDDSRTLKLSRSFLTAFRRTHPDWVVDELDLFREELPSLAFRRVDGRYMLLDGRDLFGSLKESWLEITAHIERFKSADGYLVSAPMWNFSIPYILKQYIDIIVQPRHTFQHAAGGVEGLVKGRRMAVMTSRGGQYSDPESAAYDFQEPYLRTIFGFIGIDDMTFVIAQPMDTGDRELARVRLDEAVVRAAEVGEGF